jgi:NRAMP (natural resistance-associated macrophage protein)-like metal ion transporter
VAAKKKRGWLSILGPGLVAGAADDDPSGIATYSIAGAQLGTTMLWTALLTWPLTAGVQMMCARIGMVSGYGLAEALGKKFPRWTVAAAAFALFIANTFNVGADLSGMADAAQMLTRLDARVWVVVFGAGISAAMVWLDYAKIARALKWLAMALFAYVITAVILRPHWPSILADMVWPPRFHGKEAWSTLVAILGTTIGPYLFFWQTAEEVEEQKERGKTREADRVGATQREIHDRQIDVGIGTFFSNLVMFAVIVTTALTLHVHGITKIETSQQAAEALRPLAGPWCFLLYTAGLLGVGLLAIPTLSGSAAYALAETFGWREGLGQKLGKAPAFYAVVLLSAAIGMAIDFAHVSAVSALYWSAVVNGVLAPFLLVGILLIGSDRKIMHGQPSSMLDRATVAATALFMFAAVAGMFVR